MNAKIPIILTVIIVVSAFIVVFASTHSTTQENSTADAFHYTTLGEIHTYNISPVTNFILYYVNNTNTTLALSLASQIIGNGTTNFISFNNTFATIGYFKASTPLSSFAFTIINKTLVKNGFIYGQYNTLLYDYKNTTAFGFDGYYFYIIKDNASVNTTLFLLKYLYTSQKVSAPQPSSNVIAYGNTSYGSFQLLSSNSQLILKGTGNFSNVTKLLKYFNITIGNFTVAGKVVYNNATVVIYSISATYDNKSLFVMIGINKQENYGVAVISHQEISLSEILKEL
ncbi:hypothetical protein AB1303_01365 [Saccharolobus solfataricus]|uniref:Uncharacterized protein n=2 Tax=Saccharolobus solfataricus TaxID=2287 RepID=Q97YK1_SACS2|nr:hypothetical protein [Saccharolobus solfataricus]AAK41558.1 Hypothetical protein SSO1320 [Saccharolobus solfataricus P2]QPG48976.1 hypothetical protein HFC64_02715 [Saccharolobus solfataricus]SAI84988.1 uncharacterised protein [Saccharolobus solfataricus]